VTDVVGIGTDLVDLDRFRAVLARTPRIVTRLFTDGEQGYACAVRDPSERLGARFAAKEAAMKALGVGLGEVDFRDLEVVRLASGAPVLEVGGRALERAKALGVQRWLLTMSHTHHLAQAVVLALGDDADDRERRAADDDALTQRVVRRAVQDHLAVERLRRGRGSGGTPR
jgi:holo-[acyl-carrier protein] synthase